MLLKMDDTFTGIEKDHHTTNSVGQLVKFGDKKSRGRFVYFWQLPEVWWLMRKSFVKPL